jgi:hypothetical protein
MPLALHVLLIGLSYVGLLPFHSWIDLRQGPDSAERALARVPGARLAYRPTAEELRSDFRFPRRLLRMGDSLVLAAGPMGNTTLLTIDRRTGQRLQTAKYPGLIRDIAPSPDGSAIWSTNWDYAKLAVVEPATLRARCRLDLSEHKMHSVWSVRPVGNRVYVTSQTYPVFAEFAVPPDNDPCGATLSRIIDFHDTGFTPLTDGAYGLDVDPARGAALVTVGMLEGRYKLALVEIGLDDFRIRRELRFPAGTTIIPIAGTRRVLVPSYYYGEIFEVDLEAWRLVRSIRSAANIFHLAYDPARRLIYGVSRAAGVLQVIDYDTGKLVRQDFIGNKADPLLLDGDRLLFASRFGIVEMDLSKYVGPPAARSNPGEPSKTVAPPSGQQTMDAGS